MEKIYAASLLAKLDGKVEHQPLLITAASVDDATAFVRTICLGSWPQEDGWSGHAAVIRSINRDFAADVLSEIQDAAAGLDDDCSEKQISF